MRVAPIAAAAPAALLLGLVLLATSTAEASPAAGSASTGCRDLQARVDEVLVPLAAKVGEADAIDVVLHVENGRVSRVDADGEQPAYEHGLRRALRELKCGDNGENGERRLRVLVVDRWHHLPAGHGPGG